MGVASLGLGALLSAEAVAEQAKTLITCPELFYNDRRAMLLEKLATVTPPGLHRFFLCNSGTEAVEGAIKFARMSTGKQKIGARSNPNRETRRCTSSRISSLERLSVWPVCARGATGGAMAVGSLTKAATIAPRGLLGALVDLAPQNSKQATPRKRTPS